MPRITLPHADSLTEDQQRVYDKVVSGKRGRLRGPLRAALYNPELAERWSALGELLRYSTTLTPRLSELAILVTGRACNAPFEWDAHRTEAEKAGVEADIIEALLEQRMPESASEDDAMIIQFATELNAHNSVSDATYARVLERFGPRTAVELTALVGYYTLVAMTLNTHEIPLPEGVAPAFPMPQHNGLT